MEGLPWRITLLTLFLTAGVFCRSGNHKREGNNKRYQFPFLAGNEIPQSQWTGQLPQEPVTQQSSLPFYENQMNQSPEGSFTAQQNQLMSSPAVPIATNEMFDDATNRDQLTSTSLSFLQSQYETHNSPSSANKVDYFEPNESQETPPYLDSKQFADNGPTKEDLKTIQPLLESENDIAKAIIKDSWSQDTALSSPRQAVTEGLATSHQMANVDLNNKPILKENPSKQVNHNNLVSDQLLQAVLGQEKPSKQVNHSDFVSDQDLPATSNKQNPSFSSQATLSSSVKTVDKIPSDDSSILTTNSTKQHGYNLVAPFLKMMSSSMKNNSTKMNLSISDSHKEWFSNATVTKENSTKASSKNDQSTTKAYTAADYLQSLYPELSVFKAPFEIDEKNPSKASSFLQSVQLSTLSPLSSLLSRNRTVHDNSSLTSIKNMVGSNKLSPEMQRKIQKVLQMSLLQSSKSRERSTVKQSSHIRGYLSSAADMLLTRSRKPSGKKAPGYRYLTEAGAKLLPAHIFSPLGSEFKDSLGYTSLQSRTSPSTLVQANGTRPTGGTIAPIEPTQMGIIQPKSNAKVEPTGSLAIKSTQFGLIPSPPKGLAQKDTIGGSKLLIKRPRKTHLLSLTKKKESTFNTTAATKNSDNPTQPGFVPSVTVPTKAVLSEPAIPTKERVLPTETEAKLKKSVFQKDNGVKHGRERNKPKISSIKQRSSLDEMTVIKGHTESLVSPLREKARPESRSYFGSSRFHVLKSLVSDRSSDHSRVRRQVLLPLPLLQGNGNPQQFEQSLFPGQVPDPPFLPTLPQLQQPVPQYLPTQSLPGFLPQFAPAPQAMDQLSLLGQPDARSQFPLQQPLNNQIPQSLFAPQQPFPDSGISFRAPPQPSLQQLSSTLGLTPLQHVLPQRTSQTRSGFALNEPMSSLGQDLSPVTVNVPMAAPQKIPSFLTASQVYRDFEDVNSRSHLSDDIIGSQSDPARNEFNPEDDQLPEEPKYDKFAFENDKKMWGLDNDFSEDEDIDGMGSHGRKERRLHHNSEYSYGIDESHPTSSLRYGSGGRRHYRPRPLNGEHWVDEDTTDRLNGKGIIGHNEGIDEELNDFGAHPADETTENAIKEDSYETHHHKYHHSPKHIRPGTDDEEGNEPSEKTKTTESETGVPVSDTDTVEPDTDSSEDSEQEHQSEANISNDKTERDEELKDGLEESPSEESPGVSPSTTSSVSSPKPTPGPPSSTMKEEIIKKLARSAVMHLNFDSAPVKPADNAVHDQSGNKNDADLSNGAEISNRTMGSCGRVADLKHGEVMYKANHFTRKPTKAASIAMWIKSRKTGLVRWFDVDDGKEDDSGKKMVKVPKNQWIHLAGTFDSKDGIARVYVNGKLISETVGKKNKGLPDDFTATGIGQKFGDKFISFLDDVFMFDRVITPAEVKMLYKKCEFNRMVLHYGFQKANVTTHQVMDQSGLDNNATLEGGAHILNSGCDKCGACLDASNDKMPSVYLDGKNFHHKPNTAISIASWISLNQTKGRHSIFQAVSNKHNDEWHDIYNLEVVNGKLHWRHKTSNGDVAFDVKTDDVAIPEGLWSHVTATYSAESGDAKIYVNGLLKGTYGNPRKPKLSDSWGRILIGGHLPDGRNFGGLLDEIFIYNWELDQSEVRFVLKYCADKPKLVSFTVRVPLFKRQRVQSAPTALRFL
ncbi:uncharacterized protein LOC111329957 isoform X2 [Stylophora pistillata]|uniref:uncharacterized protein LOC111329957 isoform X2 n=1 Tax=Stylophora pistillata TaxID=50429 RepID=UPI000C043B47|nr:uncharacterized protein LOC111329957 isoform X2 [Stylophora pistillata]